MGSEPTRGSVCVRFRALLKRFLDSRCTSAGALRCFEAAQALRHHERNARIDFSSQRRCFVLRADDDVRERRLRGATTALARLLCGSTEVGAAWDKMFWRKQRRKRGVAEKQQARRPCAMGGANHGSLVHRQVEQMIAMMTHTGAYDERAAAQFDPCVFRLINACLNNDWLPFESEFKLWDADIGIGSAIDLVCIDVRQSHIVLVELKNGYDDQRYALIKTHQCLQRPFQHLPNSPYFRHVFQVLLYRIMLERAYGVEPDMIATAIVRISSETGDAYVYDMPEWAASRKARDVVYNLLRRQRGTPLNVAMAATAR